MKGLIASIFSVKRESRSSAENDETRESVESGKTRFEILFLRRE